MNVDIDLVKRGIHALYYGEAGSSEQQEAHDWLMELGEHKAVVQLGLKLLENHDGRVEVMFFACQLVLTKIRTDWGVYSDQEMQMVLEFVMKLTLENMDKVPPLVRSRLLLVLASICFRSLVKNAKWMHQVVQLLETNHREEFLLEFLTFMVDEADSQWHDLTKHETVYISPLMQELKQYTLQIIRLVMRKQETNLQTAALKCLHAWVTCSIITERKEERVLDGVGNETAFDDHENENSNNNVLFLCIGFEDVVGKPLKGDSLGSQQHPSIMDWLCHLFENTDETEEELMFQEVVTLIVDVLYQSWSSESPVNRFGVDALRDMKYGLESICRALLGFWFREMKGKQHDHQQAAMVLMENVVDDMIGDSHSMIVRWRAVCLIASAICSRYMKFLVNLCDPQCLEVLEILLHCLQFPVDVVALENCLDFWDVAGEGLVASLRCSQRLMSETKNRLLTEQGSLELYSMLISSFSQCMETLILVESKLADHEQARVKLSRLNSRIYDSVMVLCTSWPDVKRDHRGGVFVNKLWCEKLVKLVLEFLHNQLFVEVDLPQQRLEAVCEFVMAVGEAMSELNDEENDDDDDDDDDDSDDEEFEIDSNLKKNNNGNNNRVFENLTRTNENDDDDDVTSSNQKKVAMMIKLIVERLLRCGWQTAIDTLRCRLCRLFGMVTTWIPNGSDEMMGKVVGFLMGSLQVDMSRKIAARSFRDVILKGLVVMHDEPQFVVHLMDVSKPLEIENHHLKGLDSFVHYLRDVCGDVYANEPIVAPLICEGLAAIALRLFHGRLPTDMRAAKAFSSNVIQQSVSSLKQFLEMVFSTFVVETVRHIDVVNSIHKVSGIMCANFSLILHTLSGLHGRGKCLKRFAKLIVPYAFTPFYNACWPDLQRVVLEIVCEHQHVDEELLSVFVNASIHATEVASNCNDSSSFLPVIQSLHRCFTCTHDVSCLKGLVRMIDMFFAKRRDEMEEQGQLIQHDMISSSQQEANLVYEVLHQLTRTLVMNADADTSLHPTMFIPDIPHWYFSLCTSFANYEMMFHHHQGDFARVLDTAFHGATRSLMELSGRQRDVKAACLFINQQVRSSNGATTKAHQALSACMEYLSTRSGPSSGHNVRANILLDLMHTIISQTTLDVQGALVQILHQPTYDQVSPAAKQAVCDILLSNRAKRRAKASLKAALSDITLLLQGLMHQQTNFSHSTPPRNDVFAEDGIVEIL